METAIKKPPHWRNRTPAQLEKYRLKGLEYIKRKKLELPPPAERKLVEDGSSEKACKRCHTIKPVEQFRKVYNLNGSIVWGGVCSECWNARRRAARKTIPSVKAKHCATTMARYNRKKSDPAFWCSHSVSAARIRARKQNLPFSLTVADVLAVLPEDLCCPIFGVPLVFGKHGQYSPSLDKIIPSLGYVRGNVAIISVRANLMKSNANAFELSLLSQWLEREELYRGIVSLEVSEVAWKKKSQPSCETKDGLVLSGT